MKKMVISLAVSLFLIGLYPGCAIVGAKEPVKNVSLPLPNNAKQEAKKKTPQIMVGVLDDDHATLPVMPPPLEQKEKKSPEVITGESKEKIAVAPASVAVKNYDDSNDSAPAPLKSLTERVADLEDRVNFHHPETRVAGLGNIAIGKSELDDSAKKYLKALAVKVKNGEAQIMEIIGYTDITKPKSGGITNKMISLQRAEAAVKFLQEEEINTSGIKMIGASSTEKYGENSKNRRITIIVKRLK